MAVNKELLLQTLAYIEEHPEEWRQGRWRCGSTACFAGHAALLAGAEWLHKKEINQATDEKVRAPDGAVEWVNDYAKHVLGLTTDVAEALFHGNNTLSDLRRIVAGLVDPEAKA